MNYPLKKNLNKRCLQVFNCAVFSLFLPSVVAETKPYSVPLPPNMLEQRVELVEPQGSISLLKALSLALLHNPDLQKFAWDIRIADVNILRAGLLANPELEIEAENFLGSGQQSDFDQTETTVYISQLFELGGKRIRREELADTVRDLALWDYETKRLDIIYQVTTRYLDVLANQHRVKLAIETTAIAEEIYNTMAARVNAGKASPLEKSKSRIELAKARLNKARILARLISSNQNLVAVWGSVNPLFNAVRGDLHTVQPVPRYSTLLSRLKNNPDLARNATEIARYQKAIALARAQKIPNITFTAGGRHFAENDDLAMVAGISAPLFIFDNKQTTVDKSLLILSQTRQKQRAVKITMRKSLMASYQQLKLNQIEITAFQDEVLPSAKEVFKAAKVAYKLGDIGSLDLLDAQHIVFKSSSEYLEALTAFQLNVAKIERLIAGPLNPASKQINEEVH